MMAIVALVFGASISVHAQDDGVGLWITGAWARPTAAAPDMAAEPAATPAMGGMGMGMHGSGAVSAAYMTIENRSAAGYQLVAAESSVAGVVEIHESTMEGDVMRMRPVEAIEIAPGESVRLEPGGLHIMLMDLQRDLYPGEAIIVTLVFESGAELVVPAAVTDLLNPMVMG
jgi:copper(I)-binding protein